MTNGCFLSKLA